MGVRVCARFLPCYCSPLLCASDYLLLWAVAGTVPELLPGLLISQVPISARLASAHVYLFFVYMHFILLLKGYRHIIPKWHGSAGVCKYLIMVLFTTAMFFRFLAVVSCCWDCSWRVAGNPCFSGSDLYTSSISACLSLLITCILFLLLSYIAMFLIKVCPLVFFWFVFSSRVLECIKQLFADITTPLWAPWLEEAELGMGEKAASPHTHHPQVQ
jgi:hypothetical protein